MSTNLRKKVSSRLWKRNDENDSDNNDDDDDCDATTNNNDSCSSYQSSYIYEDSFSDGFSGDDDCQKKDHNENEENISNGLLRSIETISGRDDDDDENLITERKNLEKDKISADLSSNSDNERNDLRKEKHTRNWDTDDYDDDDDDEEYSSSTDEEFIYESCQHAERKTLISEIEEVQRHFGESSAYCFHQELVHGVMGTTRTVVYLTFPIIGGSLDEKRDLGGAWGFDPSEPIVLRLIVPSERWDRAPFGYGGVKSLKVVVYQGDKEPPLLLNDNTKNKMDENEETCSSSGGGTMSCTELEIDKGQCHYLDHQGRKVQYDKPKSGFRLGHQITSVAEAFLVANWRAEDRQDDILTLPRSDACTKNSVDNAQSTANNPFSLFNKHKKSLQNCPNCTFLNEPEATTCVMCLMKIVESQKVVANNQTKNVESQKVIANNNQKGPQKSCKVCTFLNPISSNYCQMCGKDLISNNDNTKQSNMRKGMLQPFLTQASFVGNGLLVRLYSYLNSRLPYLHRFCVNCDHPHLNLFGMCEPLRPSVCRRELCSWAFMELRVGRASTDELASTAEVVDLLLAITSAAAMSRRAEQILNPFPLLIDNNKKQKILDPKTPNYQKAREIVSNLPSMQQIAASEHSRHLETICQRMHLHAYGLFQWIINSCPAHLVSLQGNHRLLPMGTEFQFLIRSASPEVERAFSKSKKTHGSTFGFHGSPIENWHSILHGGIKNMSGTPYQMHGATYGAGVYISPSAATSLGYSKVHGGNHTYVAQDGSIHHNNNGNNFLTGNRVHILALCELINDGNIKKNGDIWVLPNDRNIVTRFLFVFVPSSPGFRDAYDAACKCNTTFEEFNREVRAVIKQTWGKQYES